MELARKPDEEEDDDGPRMRMMDDTVDGDDGAVRCDRPPAYVSTSF